MFLEQAINSSNQFYKYIIGFIVIAIASIVGQIPLMAYVAYLSSKNNVSYPTNETEMFKMMDSNMGIFLMMLSFVTVFLIFPNIVRGIHKMNFKDVITTRFKIDYSRVFYSFGVWGSLVLLSVAVDYILFPEDYILQFSAIDFGILFIIALVLVPIQATTEELLLRGYLMQGFGLLFKNKWMPLISTALLFGIMHGLNPEVSKLGYMILIYYIGGGLFLGIITLMDEGLELAMGFHIANNLISILLVTTDWGAIQGHSILKDTSEPDIIYAIFLPVFVAFPVLLVIFAKRYQWEDWNQKLLGSIKN